MGVAANSLKSKHGQLCYQPYLFKMCDIDATNFPGFAPKDFDNYVDEMIGDYATELEKWTFTDEKQTTYLMAVKYNSHLIWESYNHNENMFFVDHHLAMVNTDV